MSEVAKNVYVTDSIVADLLEDPRKWLDGHDGFEARYVGGLHNLSQHDKRQWARQADGPLRIIETGSGREEVWFPLEWKSPVFISLDAEGRLTSHLRNMDPTQPQPTLKQDQRLKSIDGMSEDLFVEFSLWYEGDHIHRSDDGEAVLSSKMRIRVPENDVIAGVAIDIFREFWKDGEWTGTSIGDMSLIFHKKRLNGSEMDVKVWEWLAEHCQSGFFPFEDPMFRDPEEEFLFLADICSKG